MTKNEITVLGGSQIRPNIHIEDVTDIYIKMLLNKNAYSILVLRIVNSQYSKNDTRELTKIIIKTVMIRDHIECLIKLLIQDFHQQNLLIMQ